MGASPAAAVALTRMNAEIDVRHVLKAVRVPTLVLHRTGDKTLLVQEGRYVAEQIPGARFIELPGNDYLPFASNQHEILDEMEDFVASVSHARDPERVLATILYAAFAPAGAEGASTQAALEEGMRQELEWFRGAARRATLEHLIATFHGPARAVRCASALLRHAARLGYRMRAALHAGECDQLDGNVVDGAAVEVAGSILRQRSTDGGILASNTVRNLVAGSGIQFEEAGALQMEWKLYRAAGPRR